MLRHRRDAERFACLLEEPPPGEHTAGAHTAGAHTAGEHTAGEPPAALRAAEAWRATPTAARLVPAARTVQLLSERASRLAPEPPEQFRAALRQRLLAVATVDAAQPGTGPAAAGSVRLIRRRRVAVTLASVTAGLVVATGVVVGGGVAASAGSLPGEPLYAVKRATESVQLRTASGLLERGNRHLQLARTRATEIRRLVDKARDSEGGRVRQLPGSIDTQVRETLVAMNDEVQSSSALLTRVATTERNGAPLRQLINWTSSQRGFLDGLLPILSPTTKVQAVASATLLGQVQERASTDLAGTFGSPADPRGGAPRPTQQDRPPTAPPTVSPSAPPIVSPSAPPIVADPPRTLEPVRPARPAPSAPAAPRPVVPSRQPPPPISAPPAPAAPTQPVPVPVPTVPPTVPEPSAPPSTPPDEPTVPDVETPDAARLSPTVPVTADPAPLATDPDSRTDAPAPDDAAGAEQLSTDQVGNGPRGDGRAALDQREPARAAAGPQAAAAGQGVSDDGRDAAPVIPAGTLGEPIAG